MKRIVIKTTVLIILGAIVNVAVAWGCAIRNGTVIAGSTAFHNPSGEDPPIIFVTRRVGQEIVQACARSGTFLHRHRGEARVYRNRPWWDQASLNPILANLGIATGWPMLTVSSAFSTEYDETLVDLDKEDRYVSTVHGGLVFRRGQLNWFHADPLPVILSWQPIFPGFAINTVFYAAILWLLFAAPGMIRRRRRIKRGLCPACRYPVGESDMCTECGAVVQCVDRQKLTAESARKNAGTKK